MIFLYSAHRAVIFAIAQLSCNYFTNSVNCRCQLKSDNYGRWMYMIVCWLKQVIRVKRKSYIECKHQKSNLPVVEWMVLWSRSLLTLWNTQQTTDITYARSSWWHSNGWWFERHLGRPRTTWRRTVEREKDQHYNLYCVGGDVKPCSINQSMGTGKDCHTW